MSRPGGPGTADPQRTARRPAAPPPGRRALVLALMMAMALAALDSAVVATAVPRIVADLGGFSYFSWLFSGYLLAGTVSLPVYGKLSDTLGRKPVLLFGITLFLAGSALCAASWNMAALIVFRIVQGFGGGAIQSTVQTLAADLYPLEERPRIQAAISSVWAGAAVLGPAVGGLITTWTDWRLIFLLNVPVGLVSLVLLARRLSEPPRKRAAGRLRADWTGALALFLTGCALLTAIVQGGHAWPWLSAPSLALFGTGAALLAVTVVVERRAADPVLPGWVWRRRTIAAANLAMGALGVMTIAPTVFLPTYAQSVLGLDPLRAGFVLAVMSVAWPISAAFSQHVYRRIGFRQSAMTGMAVACPVLLAFPALSGTHSPWYPALISLALGACLGITQLPLLVGVQSTVPVSERGTATASLLFCRQLGSSIGAAVFGALANAILNSRLQKTPSALPSTGGSPLDAVSSTTSGAVAGPLRDALATAVDWVYIGAAAAAALAVLALFLAPRRFPVLD
ncbi:MFS transporter [Streptomyces sp. DSM 41527]|uniref:MFS transporter n=1 Tax=Streptomyces mooreae TaxID=3075523 RepID=A0ABU2T380_9ACTN|nr:MFS transporter [Streptomyces sp. DSM 41527]MDT0455672.1 MFS transporter [Streptomyces sp. DSM 41527]